MTLAAGRARRGRGGPRSGQGRPLKAELRREYLRLRSGLGPEADALGARAQRALTSHPCFLAAQAVMVYLAFRGEVSTSLVIEACLGRGKVVTAPVVVWEEKGLLPYRLTGREGEARPGAYGILEPDPSLCEPFPPNQLGLVVVPGLAFDARGGRLGYGGGFYDRFLRRDAPQATRAALAFEVQVAAGPLPLDAHDTTVDFVFTEKRIIRGMRRQVRR